ncbi:hypothetical protein AAG570_003012 [Ranatra chinensis]|uniref:Uncharacterized protein n=1 Tax=Ranatra chinensis TaxID=642074 RepID=A0ABD0Y5M1_9HEMI
MFKYVSEASMAARTPVWKTLQMQSFTGEAGPVEQVITFSNKQSEKPQDRKTVAATRIHRDRLPPTTQAVNAVCRNLYRRAVHLTMVNHRTFSNLNDLTKKDIRLDDLNSLQLVNLGIKQWIGREESSNILHLSEVKAILFIAVCSTHPLVPVTSPVYTILLRVPASVFALGCLSWFLMPTSLSLLLCLDQSEEPKAWPAPRREETDDAIFLKVSQA